MNRNDGAVGDARKRVAAGRDEARAELRTRIEDWLIDERWPEPYDLSHAILASDWLARVIADAKAEALREAVARFRSIHTGADLPTDQGRRVFVDALQMGTFLDWLEATR